MRVRKVAHADLAHAMREDWVDPGRRPHVSAGIAYVPVRDGYRSDLEIDEPARYRGRGFFMLGDVAVMHGTPPSKDELEKIITLRNPRGIVLIHAVDSPTRIPDCEILYGECGEVRHKENGYTFVLDPCRVMFSQGNLSEKQRMADLIRAGKGQERVADMFAGIGYFTIPMAGAGASVHAIEINPVAFNYLEQNIVINDLSNRISPSLGDCRTMLTGTYDRIVMGHFDAIAMLPYALPHARAGTIIHLHSIGSTEEDIRSQLAGAGFSADIRVHKVKKYSPHAWHVVQDILIT
ncbi:MAG: tRNA wyosine derivatives biosynthesis protein Taw2 [Methanoregula sp. PtaU1.Bin051]|nr:MAG: tRNA wyosine derivatives biosynthesis protein Taw2 [Methanoregula sp. PtaU1.Bin051]